MEFLSQLAPEAWSKAASLAARFPDVRAATKTALGLASRHRAFAMPTAGLPDLG
jgi:hypothetical protein